MIPRYYESLDKIGGSNTIVEVDESKFGKRKYNRGHHVEGVWILGMVERTERRRIVLVQVDNRSKNTLENHLTNRINSESTIITDCWKGYNGMNSNFSSHLTVNHSRGFVNRENNACTNTIEGTWFAVKAQVPVRNRTNRSIGLYLLRFMILRNESEEDPLNEFIKFLL